MWAAGACASETRPGDTKKMNKTGWIAALVGAVALLAAAPVYAQVKAAGKSSDQPIEISSDQLDVQQDAHKAIFSGNVIAVQGTTQMRSAEMVVFYRDSGTKAATPVTTPNDAKPAPTQGIYRIEAQGKVVFTTPTETALGDKGIYNVDTDTIDLLGDNVTLTRGQNVLKGTHMVHNMTTGRSILTGGAKGGKPARVHGLFVPKSDDAGK